MTLSKPVSHASDVELARRALNGESKPVEVMLERMRCVPRFLMARNKQLGGPLGISEIQDLIQDVLALVWRKLSSYRGEAALETWVYRICFLEFMRILRSNQRDPQLLDDLQDGAPEPSVQPGPSAVEFEHVYEGLDKLDPEEADVVRLKHFEDMTFDAMASRLGISANTAKTRYYRALFRLRSFLGAEIRAEVAKGDA